MCRFEEVLKDLSKHHRSKSKLLIDCMSDRLNKSLQVYYKEVNNSYDYLVNKDSYKVAKLINKEEERLKW